jgi:hydroxyethylthiazole kinase
MAGKPTPDLGRATAEMLARIRQRKPLLHHITNFVVMNDTANVTLHVGALPVMAHAREEVAEMVAAAGALVLNPGTLTPEWVEAMLIAGRRANELGIPVVLDPVGAGATTLRTQANQRLLRQLKIAVLRGNSGEVGALAGMGGVVKGVESVVDVADPIKVARTFARQQGIVVAITGKQDVISDGERVVLVDNGDPWLKTITGTGCMSTTMIAAFCAVEQDHLLAASGGLIAFGLAAELAAPQAKGPASFKAALFDALYDLTAEQIVAGAKAMWL